MADPDSQFQACSTIQHVTDAKQSHILLKESSTFHSISTKTWGPGNTCTFRWWAQLRQKPWLFTRLQSLAKILATSQWNVSKGIGCNGSYSQAAHFTGNHFFPKAKISLSENITLLRVTEDDQNPTEKACCFQHATNATASEKRFTATVSDCQEGLL